MIDQPLLRNAVGAALAIAILAAPPARGEEALPEWERALYKTLTFQTAANLADVVLFGAIVGGTAATGGAFLLANTATAAAVYYPYELAWGALGPGPAATTSETLAAKTIGYQALTAGRNLVLTYAFSGALLTSAGFVVATTAVDAAIYVANELAWDELRPRATP